jgi:hypothetical protein
MRGKIMGRGNWFPSTPKHQGEYNLVYVEVLDAKQHCQWEVDTAYEQFNRDVLECLPKSFSKINPYDSLSGILGGDDVVMFANGLLLVVMDCRGDHWHQGIAIVARADAPKFAESWVDPIAERLWKGLARKGYLLQRRTCAWTSIPFTPNLGKVLT